MQNKLRFGIAAIGVILIALYTYCLVIFGGEYLNGIGYITYVGVILIFTLFVILIKKSIFDKNKKVFVLLSGTVVLSGLFVISGITGTTFIYNAEMLVIAVWPFVCYAMSKYINVGNMIGRKSFVFDFIIHNIITVGLIVVFEEFVFKYKYIAADVIAEMYMYMISVITFMLYSKKAKKIKLDKWDILCVITIIGVTVISWIFTHERIVSIIESLNHKRTTVDADGEYENWISHRVAMIKVAFNADFSMVNIHRLPTVIKGCSLAWLSSAGSIYVSIVVLLLSTIILALMIIYARQNKSVLINVIALSFILKLIVGITANVFLIFSTSVGVPLIRNVYDIILLITVIDLTEAKKQLV